MGSILNASGFFGTITFRNCELEALLVYCVDIYNNFIINNFKCHDDEELIRDIFFDSLNDDTYRGRNAILQNYHFEKEPQEKSGYLDIKIKTINPYISTKAYYCIECKRLGADSTGNANDLNTEYVKNGICRFVENYYSSYYGCNAMLGFIVNKVCVQKDIIDNINSKLNKDYRNTQKQTVNARGIKSLQYVDFANSYPYSYISTHTHISGKELVLYHLMFDFSNNII
jgi:hypothetical protein